MTDKEQIIIDGVNVSGCNHYKNGSCEIEVLTPCPYYNNCYYKQLKRKEQELEYYKIQFNADTKEMDGYQNEIVKHLESIEYLRTQLRNKEQE